MLLVVMLCLTHKISDRLMNFLPARALEIAKAPTLRAWD